MPASAAARPNLQTDYSPAEVAALCGITERTVQRWILAGRLRGAKVRGLWCIDAEEVRRFLNEAERTA